MTTMTTRRRAAVATAAAEVLLVTTAATAWSVPPHPDRSAVEQRIAEAIFDALNAERAARGLPTVVPAPGQDKAQTHARTGAPQSGWDDPDARAQAQAYVMAGRTGSPPVGSNELFHRYWTTFPRGADPAVETVSIGVWCDGTTMHIAVRVYSNDSLTNTTVPADTVAVPPTGGPDCVGGGTPPPPPPPPPPPSPPPPTDSPACPEGTASHSYTDVGPHHTHRHGIGCVSAWNVAHGHPDGTFRPSRHVSRAQAAAFTVRLVEAAGGHLPDTWDEPFDDVRGTTHADAIHQLAAAGLVSGTSPNRFGPSLPVTRAQTATLLTGVWQHITGQPLPTTGHDPYHDIAGSPHRDAIRRAAAAGLVSGHPDGTFRPAAPSTRAQTATVLTNLLDRLVTHGHTPPGPPAGDRDCGVGLFGGLAVLLELLGLDPCT